MKKITSFLICMVLLGFALPSIALPILYSADGPLVSQVEASEPIGQSFIAEDASVEAGLYFEAINPFHPNSDSIQYDLYSGVGTSGTLLESAVFSLADDFVGFHMEDFSNVTLNIGDAYSLVATILGNSPYWGIRSTLDPSAPSRILNGSAVPGSYALSVNPIASVPEPAIFSLLALGLAGIGFIRRKA